MTEVTRRSFMARASVGAAAAGALVLTKPFSNHSETIAAAPHTPVAAASEGEVFAHLRDLGNGEVDLYVGEQVMTVRDRALADSLAHAVRS